MTVTVQTVVFDTNGDGVTTEFPFDHYFAEDEDIKVVTVLIASPYTETVKTLTTHYTVTGAGDSDGGAITFLVAPANTVRVRRILNPVREQTLLLGNRDAVPMVPLMTSLDDLENQVQRNGWIAERSLRLSDGSNATLDPTIPRPVAGAVLAFSDPVGTIIAGPTVTAISAAAANAAAAAVSAAAALASQTAAASSQTAAASSASAAATSASGAATSATTATTQAANAATSATTATTQAANAATSATTATTQATNAAASASTATTQAAAAASSASGAATSATTATTQASTATTQASAAAASAVLAQAAVTSMPFNDVVYLTFASSPYTVGASDGGKLLAVDTSGGNVVVNLPSLAATVLPYTVSFKKTTNDVNTLTVNRNGTDVIDQAAATSWAATILDMGAIFVGDITPAPDRWVTYVFGPVAGLADASVTLAKMANLAQDQAIIRITASTGVPETATITAAARTVLDDTTVGAMRATLGTVGVVAVQVFTVSGTYTPTTGMVYCITECIGAGGGGGAADGQGTGFMGGAGGGGGGYSRKVSTAAAIGASQTVTIGAGGTAGATASGTGGTGGDTSLGSICIGKGGSGGVGQSNAIAGALGGAGGVAGTGDVAAVGPRGGNGSNAQIASLYFASGNGASTAYGSGGAGGSPTLAAVVAGGAGTGYGSGGGGGASQGTASDAAGGAGAGGLVIITEYVTA